MNVFSLQSNFNQKHKSPRVWGEGGGRWWGTIRDVQNGRWLKISQWDMLGNRREKVAGLGGDILVLSHCTWIVRFVFQSHFVGWRQHSIEKATKETDRCADVRTLGFCSPSTPRAHATVGEAIYFPPPPPELPARRHSPKEIEAGSTLSLSLSLSFALSLSCYLCLSLAGSPHPPCRATQASPGSTPAQLFVLSFPLPPGSSRPFISGFFEPNCTSYVPFSRIRPAALSHSHLPPPSTGKNPPLFYISLLSPYHLQP